MILINHCHIHLENHYYFCCEYLYESTGEVKHNSTSRYYIPTFLSYSAAIALVSVTTITRYTFNYEFTKD
jgi:hypothetical protein